MKHSKLRITWSVAWGIAAVLLIVLWVRSYTCFDFCHVRVSGGWSLHFQSVHGRGVLFALPYNRGWQIGSFPDKSVILAGELTQPMGGTAIPGGGASINVFEFEVSHRIVVSYWLAALIPAALAVAPWIRWRFSLRTLLIAITLVAVGLGTVVWLTH